MNFLNPLFLGFASAFVGILPPGLINMTAVKVNLKDGRKTALWFIFGAIIIVLFQAYIAIFFARIINARPDLLLLLREIGLGLFLVLSVYFLAFAKKPKIKKASIKNSNIRQRFFLGMLLSALNFFPIPYYVFVSITLLSYSLFSFHTIWVLFFVAGVVLGSSFVFYLYIIFFQKIESKAHSLLKHINLIIGGVTGVIAVITLINILKNYFG
jgi:threonine/homoserine/homoserine lactone efflux protein